MCLEVDRYAMRLEHRCQGLRDLLADPLLDREALGEQAHEAGKLGDANDVLVSNISHVGVTVKWERMVLT
jgi:hypothetical protein